MITRPDDRREFLRRSALAFGGLGFLPPAEGVSAVSQRPVEPRAQRPPTDLKVQRLTWAGVLFESEDTAFVLDPLTTDIWEGRDVPEAPLVTKASRRYAVVTHLHNDHYDRLALRTFLGERGRVFCHSSIASVIASDGFRVWPVEHFEPAGRGPFSVTAVPAVDGLGAKQVSWVISCAGRRVIHCGDTLWHGHWWRIRNLGPFDAAYLPINGARMPMLSPPSTIPASLTPVQAVVAAELLGADVLTPIHYGFHNPGSYEEFPHAIGVCIAEAAARNVTVEVLEPGQWAGWVDG